MPGRACITVSLSNRWSEKKSALCDVTQGTDVSSRLVVVGDFVRTVYFVLCIIRGYLTKYIKLCCCVQKNLKFIAIDISYQ